MDCAGGVGADGAAGCGGGGVATGVAGGAVGAVGGGWEESDGEAEEADGVAAGVDAWLVVGVAEGLTGGGLRSAAASGSIDATSKPRVRPRSA